MGTSSQCCRVLDQVRRKRDGVEDQVMLQRQLMKEQIQEEHKQAYSTEKKADNEEQVANKEEVVQLETPDDLNDREQVGVTPQKGR